MTDRSCGCNHPMPIVAFSWKFENLQPFSLSMIKKGNSSREAERCRFCPNCRILMALIYTSVVCVLCVRDFYISTLLGWQKIKCSVRGFWFKWESFILELFHEMPPRFFFRLQNTSQSARRASDDSRRTVNCKVALNLLKLVARAESRIMPGLKPKGMFNSCSICKMRHWKSI